MADALLEAVEALRLACPPEGTGGSGRDQLVRAAGCLAAALAAPPPLLPLQFEVLLRQSSHLLGTVRGWPDSGTAEAAVGASLSCVRRLLRASLFPYPAAPHPSTGQLLSAPGARPATCELLSTLLVTASDQRANRLRGSCVRAVWGVLMLPLDAPVAAYILPGVATQLVEIGCHGACSHAPTCLAALGAMRALLCAVFGYVPGEPYPESMDSLSTVEAVAAEGLASLRAMAVAKPILSGGRGAGRAVEEAPLPAPRGPAQHSQSEAERFTANPQDPLWVKETTQRLAPLLSRLGASCLACTRPRIRMRLVLLLNDITSHLPRCGLIHCASVLVELLAGSARDEFTAVRSVARAVLATLARRLPSGTHIGNLLVSSFERQLTTLPRTMRAAAEAPKVRALRLLASQLELVAISAARPPHHDATVSAADLSKMWASGGGLSCHSEGSATCRAADAHYTSNAGHFLPSRLGSICTTLFAVLRFAPQSMAIEQRIGKEAARLVSGATAQQRLAQLRSPSSQLHLFVELKDMPTVEAMRELCETIGRVSSAVHLTHQLIPVICATSERGAAPRREAAWLLSHALIGTARRIDSPQSSTSGDAAITQQPQADPNGLSEALVAGNALEMSTRERTCNLHAGPAAGDEVESDLEPETDELETLLLINGGFDQAPWSHRRRASGPHAMGPDGKHAKVFATNLNPSPPALELTETCLSELEDCVMMLLREIVAPAVWERQVGAKHLSLGEQHALLQERCLLVELVGSCCEVLGAISRATYRTRPPRIPHQDPFDRDHAHEPSESLQVALRLCLLPLLERLGDDAAITSEAAERTLCRITLAHHKSSDPHAGAQHGAVSTRPGVCENLGETREELIQTRRHPAGHAAHSFRQECASPTSVRELLAQNGDFLLDAIARRLRHSCAHPRLPLVLEALLTYAAVETLPLLADVVDDIIALADDAVDAVGILEKSVAQTHIVGPFSLHKQNGPTILACARAMRALVSAAVECQDYEEASMMTRGSGVGTSNLQAGNTEGGEQSADEHSRWVDGVFLSNEAGSDLQLKDSHNGDGFLSNDELRDGTPLCAFFRELFSDVLCATSTTSDNVSAAQGDDPGSAEEGDPEMKKVEQELQMRAEEEEERLRNTPPLAPGLALRVVVKLEQLLLCAPPMACHVLLDTLAIAIPLLRPWPRALLPVLHKLWAPLTHLLDASDLTLAAKAMGALSTAASILCDEISATSMKEVFPPLLRVIRNHGSLTAIDPIHLRATGTAAITPRSRPQDVLLAALRLLRALCHIPRAATPRVAAVLTSVEPLLSKRQPERVRTEALSLVKDLATLQRDVVWLFCARVVPVVERTRPPLSNLPHFPTAGMQPLPGPAADFDESAQQLLLHIDSEDRKEWQRQGLGTCTGLRV